jgi:hypothetical protein
MSNPDPLAPAKPEDSPALRPSTQDERWRHDKAHKLKLVTSIFVCVVIGVLAVFGLLGWANTSEIIDAIYLTQTPTAAPTVTPVPAGTETPTGTSGLTVTATLVASATIEAMAYQPTSTIAGQAIVQVSSSPTSTSTSPRIPKDSAQSVVAQHFIVLAVLSAIMILFPGVLLLGFAFQQVPWLAKDLWSDLLKLGLDEKSVEGEEESTLKRQFSARFGSVEFLFPLILVTSFVFAIMASTFWPEGIYGFVKRVTADASFGTYFSTAATDVPVATVAVIVAYMFMAYGLVRRYQRSDITPGAYWEVFKRLFVVTLLGLVVSVLLGPTPDNGWVVGFGFLIGLFPIKSLGMMTKYAQGRAMISFDTRLKRAANATDRQSEEDLAQRLFPKHDIVYLDDIDEWDAERIEEDGIIGMQGMAEADLAQLVTWLPFSTAQILDWVDQAILCMAAGAEPESSYVMTLRTMGLRGASDLIDATLDEAGKLRVVLAAQAIQGKGAQDSLPLAQLAAMRVQLKVKDVQDKLAELNAKGIKANDLISEDLASAPAHVQEAKQLVDTAYEQVEVGGNTWEHALQSANSLQAKFKTVGEKADEVEKELKAITDNKVSDNLLSALKALGETITTEPTVVSQAQELIDALDQIANPLLKAESKAKEFQQKVEAISKLAESKQPSGVPQDVTRAAHLLSDLTDLAKKAQTQIKVDTSLRDAVDKVDELVKLLTDYSDGKPADLLGDTKLNLAGQWTGTGSDGKKAKAYEDAQKLAEAELTKRILDLTQKGSLVVKTARAAATCAGAAPTLTMAVLEVILAGMERNPNLRRIQKYLTEETSDIPLIKSKYKYKTNVEYVSSEEIEDKTNVEYVRTCEADE